MNMITYVEQTFLYIFFHGHFCKIPRTASSQTFYAQFWQDIYLVNAKGGGTSCKEDQIRPPTMSAFSSLGWHGWGKWTSWKSYVTTSQNGLACDIKHTFNLFTRFQDFNGNTMILQKWKVNTASFPMTCWFLGGSPHVGLMLPRRRAYQEHVLGGWHGPRAKLIKCWLPTCKKWIGQSFWEDFPIKVLHQL